MIGQVTKILSNSYRVTAEGADYQGIARGKLRRIGEIFVGDDVEFHLERDAAVIDRVLPRRTVLKRPYVANVDAVLIVAAPVPEPELLLIDKIIVNAFSACVTPVLAYNKIDLERMPEGLKNAYRGVLKAAEVSSATGEGLEELAALLKGKTAAFAGQSAVGKTSLLNALSAFSGVQRSEKVGGISEKSKRGKNTTRHVELFDFGDYRLVDTCGFNVLEFSEEDERALPSLYAEYEALSDGCRFRGCAHVAEPDCAVKSAVLRGELDRGRYERYKILYEELKKKRGEKYD